MRPPSRLILAVLAAAPLSARAGDFAQTPPTPGMALTPPAPGPTPGMANVAPAIPLAPPADLAGNRRSRALGSGFSSTDGQLPNQRTGPRRTHAVHDICIGC